MAAMKVKTDIITMANVYSYNYLFLESETDVFWGTVWSKGTTSWW